MERVILLNSDFTFLSVISKRRAIKLMTKEKVEILKATDKIVYNFEKTVEFVIPRILRLVRMVKCIYKNRVPFSRKNVMIRDGYICQYCGSYKELTIDHVVPKAQGGTSCFDNCVASCKPCNNNKNDRTPKQAGLRLKRKPHHPTIVEFFSIRMRSLGVYDMLKEFGIF